MNSRRRVNSIVMLLLNTMGIPFVLAEVLDKEPSIISVWAVFLMVATVGYILCRLRWWLIGIVVPIAVILSVINLSELLDTYVGPAMWQESRSYVIQSYAAMALAVMVPCIGAFLHRRKKAKRGRLEPAT